MPTSALPMTLDVDSLHEAPLPYAASEDAVRVVVFAGMAFAGIRAAVISRALLLL